MINVLFKSTTLFYTIFLLFASNAAKFGNAQQASSQRFGYNEAIKLFTDGNFDCNLDGILQFWDMVKSDTFKLCDTTYFLNQQRIESCKEGTATYTREKANACSTEEDCKNLGDIAGEAVSDRFCQVVNSVSIPSTFFPMGCQRTANRECNIEGKLTIESLANSGQCGTVSLPLTEARNLALQSECREFVRDWARTSLLP